MRAQSFLIIHTIKEPSINLSKNVKKFNLWLHPKHKNDEPRIRLDLFQNDLSIEAHFFLQGVLHDINRS